MEQLLTIINYGFMQRALLAGLAVALVAPSLGIFIVARRQALIADTLSHATLAGAAFGALLGTASAWPPVAAALMGALILERLRRGARVPSDAALSLILTGSLAFAVVILSAIGQNGVLMNALFGSVLTVTWAEVWWITVSAAAIGIWLQLRHRTLQTLLIDDDLGKAIGVPVEREALGLSLLTALFVAVGMRVTGVLLIGALLVLPILAAAQLGYGVRLTVRLATILAVLSVIIGLAVSFMAGTAAGATIVLVLLATAALTALVRRAT